MAPSQKAAGGSSLSSPTKAKTKARVGSRSISKKAKAVASIDIASAPSKDCPMIVGSSRASSSSATSRSKDSREAPPFDRYTFVQELGRGSCGVVWLVRRKTDGEHHAMKTITLPSVAGCKKEDIASKRQAMREVEALSAVSSPYLVRYMGVLFSPPTEVRGSSELHILTEFCDGGDLASYLRADDRSSGLPEDSVWSLGTPIVLGLDVLHQQRIIHRDLKPANIFLKRATGSLPRVLLGDFGLARSLSESQPLASTCVGTPHYCAPEIFEGSPYDEKADIYSLGACIYELMHGQPPHAEAKHLAGLVRRVLGLGTDVIGVRWDERFSASLRDIVSSCLMVLPGERSLTSELLVRIPSEHVKAARTVAEVPLTARILDTQTFDETPSPFPFQPPSRANSGLEAPAVHAVIDSGSVEDASVPTNPCIIVGAAFPSPVVCARATPSRVVDDETTLPALVFGTQASAPHIIDQEATLSSPIATVQVTSAHTINVEATLAAPMVVQAASLRVLGPNPAETTLTTSQAVVMTERSEEKEEQLIASVGDDSAARACQGPSEVAVLEAALNIGSPNSRYCASESTKELVGAEPLTADSLEVEFAESLAPSVVAASLIGVDLVVGDSLEVTEVEVDINHAPTGVCHEMNGVHCERFLREHRARAPCAAVAPKRGELPRANSGRGELLAYVARAHECWSRWRRERRAAAKAPDAAGAGAKPPLKGDVKHMHGSQVAPGALARLGVPVNRPNSANSAGSPSLGLEIRGVATATPSPRPPSVRARGAVGVGNAQPRSCAAKV